MNAPLHPDQLRAAVTLDDKYNQTTGQAFMSGIHALVRLPMM
jgi:indolepyruvate ferredoxin oxidoreductase